MEAIFNPVPPVPCPVPFNLAAHVLAHAGAMPDKTALEVLGPGGETWRYGALEQAVRGTATGLLAAGLAAGDRVLLRLGNTPDFPIAYLGAIAAGLVPVPTSAQLTQGECATIAAATTPAAVLRAPGIDSIAHPREIPLRALRDMRALPPAPYAMGDPDRMAYIVFTSGTSGQPRAVAHAHRAIWARQMMIDGWYGLRRDDRLLHAGAFNWTYTLGTGLMDPWAMGACALIAAPGTAPGDLPDLLRQSKATIFAAAPGVYRKFANHTALRDLPALRHGLSAGEKLPPETETAWRAATGTPIFEAYGLSECSTFISASPSAPAAPGCLGAPQPGRHIAIIGADGPVQIGETGTIAVHHSDPGLMLGYLGAPEETAARYCGDWFLTGDLGRMNETGQIAYLGRADDMMNAGGYRVSPLEVERALADFPGIAQVAAAEIAVKPGVQVIAAFYTGPAAIDEQRLCAHAAQRLARYKQPRVYIHLDTLPTGANGKLQRRALRNHKPKATQ